MPDGEVDDSGAVNHDVLRVSCVDGCEFSLGGNGGPPPPPRRKLFVTFKSARRPEPCAYPYRPLPPPPPWAYPYMPDASSLAVMKLPSSVPPPCTRLLLLLLCPACTGVPPLPPPPPPPKLGISIDTSDSSSNSRDPPPPPPPCPPPPPPPTMYPLPPSSPLPPARPYTFVPSSSCISAENSIDNDDSSSIPLPPLTSPARNDAPAPSSSSTSTASSPSDSNDRLNTGTLAGSPAVSEICVGGAWCSTALSPPTPRPPARSVSAESVVPAVSPRECCRLACW
ncbi:hypothetical protein BC831DRAFT_462626 [Entophlyctis helioformis]|nr:hypothetical protein BC831DRAFT_462626 [Entophlyctis helioformis]